MFSFHSSIIKISKTSVEICLVIPKERIVTLKAAELSILGCKGPSTLVSSPTYGVLSRNQFCRELRVHEGGGGLPKSDE